GVDRRRVDHARDLLMDAADLLADRQRARAERPQLVADRDGRFEIELVELVAECDLEPPPAIDPARQLQRTDTVVADDREERRIVLDDDELPRVHRQPRRRADAIRTIVLWARGAVVAQRSRAD